MSFMSPPKRHTQVANGQSPHEVMYPKQKKVREVSQNPVYASVRRHHASTKEMLSKENMNEKK
jgi:hypothetical protein